MNEIKINAEKAEIRAVYRKKRASLTDTEREINDAELCHRVTETDAYRNAASILLYFPMKNEIDVKPIMEKALLDGKKVAFPKCGKNGEMNFHYVKSENDLTPGAYGIFEPSADLPIFDLAESLAVCIVPGLVFDAEGYRVGYGGGYYDRFLAKFKGVSIAPVRRGFMSNKPLPRDEFDRKCDILILAEGG